MINKVVVDKIPIDSAILIENAIREDSMEQNLAISIEFSMHVREGHLRNDIRLPSIAP